MILFLVDWNILSGHNQSSGGRSMIDPRDLYSRIMKVCCLYDITMQMCCARAACSTRQMTRWPT